MGKHYNEALGGWIGDDGRYLGTYVDERQSETPVDAVTLELRGQLVAVCDAIGDSWLTPSDVASQVNLLRRRVRLCCSRLAKLGVLDEARSFGGIRYRVSKQGDALLPEVLKSIQSDSQSSGVSDWLRQHKAPATPHH